MKPGYLVAMLFFICVLFVTKSSAQSHGLSFFSHEVEAGKRTTLDLFPGTGFDAADDFELSFELSFRPEQINYFGYILHLEGPQRNIDLMYSKTRLIPDQSDPYLFKLINGENSSKINFHIDSEKILSQWNKVRLLIDFRNDRIVLYVNNKKYVENNARLVKSNYKFIWGISSKNSDCPPMNIRNIRLRSSRADYFWPLNEISGGIVPELNSGRNASVTHPSWIRAMHRNWRLNKSMHTKGNASIAFNESSGELYLIGQDSLLTYQLKGSKLTAVAYRSGRQALPSSNQSVYNASDQTLYNYYLDRDIKQVNTYDFKLNSWDKNYAATIMQVDYQNANNFISQIDTALYIIGGYGHFRYKNTVHRYNTVTKRLTEVKTQGDYFLPRYLAAAGTTDSGRTAYILGGYGSQSGQQIVNSKNLYDLVKLDIQTKTFKKIYDLQVEGEHFAFASSMIINEKARTFSTLIFPNNRFNSYLRLLQGNLDHPSYQLVGDSIPYKFHDVNGSANFYYDHLSKQYLAVTLLKSENDETTANVYTLQSPPDASPASDTDRTLLSDSLFIILYALTGLSVTALLIRYLVKRRKKVRLPKPVGLKHAEKNAIFLFGGMQLINHEGNDIAKQFTSLLKELFLYILINTIRSGRGTSGEKLAELLWSDKSESKAKNNRDANLSRLKSVLSQAENISLCKESGKWKIDIDYSVIYLDYYHYLQIIANRKGIGKTQIFQLIDISQRGNFLSEFDYPWLDQMKSEISNEIINVYLDYAKQIGIQDDPEFLIKIANNIFYLDSVNEEAIVIKCKALSYLGKHSLAKSSFENFIREFKALYNEDFKKDFHTILES